MKITVYPLNINTEGVQNNPYINDFINAMKQNGILIANSPDRNPLLSIVTKKTDSDAYIFHWLENVPDYKYGVLQTIAAIWLIFKIKIKRKKLIWFLHNKQPHQAKHKRVKRELMKLLMKKSDLIVTHATEGLTVISKLHQPAVAKTIFLHHPTKNRTSHATSFKKESVTTLKNNNIVDNDMTPIRDLLIWGNISQYKGVAEFVKYAAEQKVSLDTKIIGKCSSQELFEEIEKQCNEHLIIENRSLSFEELKQEIAQSHFVLIPYAAESILSSGVLMDSLSFGAKVIGPDVGSFKDYTTEPLLKVYTFTRFEDIETICRNKKSIMANLADYATFLDVHSWDNFGRILINKLLTLQRS